MSRYLTTKGLFLKSIGRSKFVIEDVFGVCTLPFSAESLESASKTALESARVRVLYNESEKLEMSSLSSFRWFDLEKYYVAKLTDHFRYWQVGHDQVGNFDFLSYAVPLAYSECGYGGGSKEILEKIDKLINSMAEADKMPFTKEYIAIKLAHLQLGRICSDIMSLVHRAVKSFNDLLNIQRSTIKEEYWAASHMNVSEIVHTGPKSYNAATSVTICVISLCSSLDISSKLIHFINGCKSPISRFHAAQGKHYSDLAKMRPSALPANLVRGLIISGTDQKNFPSLIQFRHDLIHSTTVLEMEKIHVGFQTGEVNQLPLHYSYMPSRDCLDSGQPLRYLGREYFTSAGVDIEWQLFTWINEVINFHLAVGSILYDFLKSNTIDNTGVQILSSPLSELH